MTDFSLSAVSISSFFIKEEWDYYAKRFVRDLVRKSMHRTIERMEKEEVQVSVSIFPFP